MQTISRHPAPLSQRLKVKLTSFAARFLTLPIARPSTLALLLICASVAACSGLPTPQINSVRVASISAPPPLRLDPVPDIGPDFTWPQITVWTVEDMENPVRACDAYETGPESLDEESLAEFEARIEAETGLDRYSACRFAVHGYTAQGQLDMESELNRIAGAVEALVAHIRYLRKTLFDRQDLLEAHVKAASPD